MEICIVFHVEGFHSEVPYFRMELPTRSLDFIGFNNKIQKVLYFSFVRCSHFIIRLVLNTLSIILIT